VFSFFRLKKEGESGLPRWGHGESDDFWMNCKFAKSVKLTADWNEGTGDDLPSMFIEFGEFNGVLWK